MARRSRRLTAIFSLAAVLALATMGLTYTLWSETLEVDGTVQTGTLDVTIGGTTNEKVGVDGWVLDESLFPEKESAANCSLQGSFNAALAAPGDNVNTGNNTVTVTVNGGYPSFYCIATVTVTNVGSVPVHLNQPEQTGGMDIAGLAPFDGYIEGSCYENNVQLHTGESASCEIVIHFENDDELNEGSTGVYTFSFEILAHQWNEEA